MNARAALASLFAATRGLVSAQPDLSAFVGADLDGLDCTPPEPHRLAVTNRPAALLPRAGPATAGLCRAIAAAAPHLDWRQSYTRAEVGAHYLENYGWFNIVSPEGPYLSDRIRVSVGYWERGLSYPQHRHPPEEIYCVLAGGARFESEGRAPVAAGPGALIRHAPDQRHGFSMQDTPLLAIAFWKGPDLLKTSTLEPAA